MPTHDARKSCCVCKSAGARRDRFARARPSRECRSAPTLLLLSLLAPPPLPPRASNCSPPSSSTRKGETSSASLSCAEEPTPFPQESPTRVASASEPNDDEETPYSSRAPPVGDTEIRDGAVLPLEPHAACGAPAPEPVPDAGRATSGTNVKAPDAPVSPKAAAVLEDGGAGGRGTGVVRLADVAAIGVTDGAAAAPL